MPSVRIGAVRVGSAAGCEFAAMTARLQAITAGAKSKKIKTNGIGWRG
jgi:hypothetical protein